MFKPLALAGALLCLLTANAEARQRHKATGLHPDCNRLWPCTAPSVSTPEQARVTRGLQIQRELGFGAPIERRAPRRVRKVHKPLTDGRLALTSVRSISGIVAPLAAKVAEIQAACGSKVISAVRNTFVAGTRTRSLHASGQAVDMAGNPSCIAALLVGWRGGASNDYARVNHYHISWGGREHGIRFAHGGGRKHARRYASYRHKRYAAAK